MGQATETPTTPTSTEQPPQTTEQATVAPQTTAPPEPTVEPEDDTIEPEDDGSDLEPPSEYTELKGEILSSAQMFAKMTKLSPQAVRMFLVNDLYPLLVRVMDTTEWYVMDLNTRLLEVEENAEAGSGLTEDQGQNLIEFIGRSVNLFSLLMQWAKQSSILIPDELVSEMQVLVVQAPGLMANVQDAVAEEEEEYDEEEDEDESVVSDEDMVEPGTAAEPAVAAEPEAAVEPETPAEPVGAAEPEATPEPEVAAEPESSVDPDVPVEPETPTDPAPAPEPEVAPEPEKPVEGDAS